MDKTIVSVLLKIQH